MSPIDGAARGSLLVWRKSRIVQDFSQKGWPMFMLTNLVTPIAILFLVSVFAV
jgi:hypothetical protein